MNRESRNGTWWVGLSVATTAFALASVWTLTSEVAGQTRPARYPTSGPYRPPASGPAFPPTSRGSDRNQGLPTTRFSPTTQLSPTTQIGLPTYVQPGVPGIGGDAPALPKTPSGWVDLLVQGTQVRDSGRIDQSMAGILALSADQQQQLVPLLVQHLTTDRNLIPSPFAVVLGKIPSAYPRLMEVATKDADPVRRWFAVTALRQAGAMAQGQIEGLLSAATDKDARVATEATWALYAIQPPKTPNAGMLSKSRVQAFVSGLKSASAQVREASAWGLTKAEVPLVVPHIAILAKSFPDPKTLRNPMIDETTGGALLLVLSRLGPDAAPAIPTAEAYVSGTQSQLEVARAAWLYGQAGQPGAAALRKLLDNPVMLPVVCDVMVDLPSAAASVAAELAKHLEGDPSTAIRVLAALSAAGKGAAVALTEVKRLVEREAKPGTPLADVKYAAQLAQDRILGKPVAPLKTAPLQLYSPLYLNSAIAPDAMDRDEKMLRYLLSQADSRLTGAVSWALRSPNPDVVGLDLASANAMIGAGPREAILDNRYSPVGFIPACTRALAAMAKARHGDLAGAAAALEQADFAVLAERTRTEMLFRKNVVAAVAHYRVGDLAGALRLIGDTEDQANLLKVVLLNKDDAAAEKIAGLSVRLPDFGGEVPAEPAPNPAALYHVAEYLNRNGKKDRAVAIYRQLVLQPTWEKWSDVNRASLKKLVQLGQASDAMTAIEKLSSKEMMATFLVPVLVENQQKDLAMKAIGFVPLLKRADGYEVDGGINVRCTTAIALAAQNDPATAKKLVDESFDGVQALTLPAKARPGLANSEMLKAVALHALWVAKTRAAIGDVNGARQAAQYPQTFLLAAELKEPDFSAAPWFLRTAVVQLWLGDQAGARLTIETAYGKNNSVDPHVQEAGREAALMTPPKDFQAGLAAMVKANQTSAIYQRLLEGRLSTGSIGANARSVDRGDIFALIASLPGAFDSQEEILSAIVEIPTIDWKASADAAARLQNPRHWTLMLAKCRAASGDLASARNIFARLAALPPADNEASELSERLETYRYQLLIGESSRVMVDLRKRFPSGKAMPASGDPMFQAEQMQAGQVAQTWTLSGDGVSAWGWANSLGGHQVQQQAAIFGIYRTLVYRLTGDPSLKLLE